jgi:hypothetical protein
VVSESCGERRRCDEGRCVPDEGCAANSVQPLLESVELPLPAFTDSIGSEPELAARDVASGGLLYLGLASKEKSRFDDAAAFCRLPAYCVAPSDGQVTLYRNLSSNAGVWMTADVTVVALESGGSAAALGAPWNNGDVLLSDERGLYRLAVGTGAATRLIDLAGRRPVRVIAGDSPRVVTLSSQPTQTAYEVVVLDGSPKWTSIANVRPLKRGGTAVPAGNDWFILQDGSLDNPEGIDVWHVSSGNADYIGKGDPMLLELSSLGPGPLSPQGQATLPHCEKRECSLFGVDLMVPAATQTARVDVPEDFVSIASSRPMACNGVEMIVGGYNDGDPDGVSSFYTVRLH